MMKFEPTFNDMCFPVTANKKLYNVSTLVNFLSSEEKTKVYKTYNYDTKC